MATTTTTQAATEASIGWKAERSWRMIGAAGMILGVAAFIVTTIMQWALEASSSSATVVDVVNQNPGTWQLVGVLAALGSLVWVAGIGAITSLVRGRGWVLTTIGGTVTTVGLIGCVGHVALFFGLAGDLAASGIDSAATEAVMQADYSSVISTVLLLLLLVGFSLGPILLTIGLRRARLVAVWVPVTAIVMVVANFVGGIPAGAVQLVAMLLTFGPMALVLLRRR